MPCTTQKPIAETEMPRSKTAKLLGKGKGRKGKHKSSNGQGENKAQAYSCDICSCQMSLLDEWKSHVQGKRHQTNMLLNPDWQDPYGCLQLNPQQQALLNAKRLQIEPVKQYCEHFKQMIMEENRVEQEEVMYRINNWPQWKLEEKGYAFFDMVPQKQPGIKQGVVFEKRLKTLLPFSAEMAVTQPVFATPSAAPEVEDKNKKVSGRGEIVRISRQCIEIKGLPSPLPLSADGTYRIDLANSEVTMQRMLACLESLITAHATSSSMQGSLGLGILAPQSPISTIFFADIHASQNRARSHAAMMFSSNLVMNRELSVLAQQPARGISSFVRSPSQMRAFDGDRHLEQIAQRLNTSQKEAVRRVIQDRAQLTLIQGPPGTGKTTTAVAIICEWLLKYRGNILATAYSNQGVNNLMAGLAAHGVRVIRVGKPDTNRSEFHVDQMIESNPLELQRQRLSRELQDTKRKLERYGRKPPPELTAHCQDLVQQLGRLSSGTIMAQSIEQAEVVCTTCVGAGLGMLRGIQFPFVLIDEATQAVEPAALIPFFHGSSQIVMVGDQCQLPPTVVSEEVARAGFDISMFDRLIGNGLETQILNTQYRMHPSISAFPSARFYKGLLKDGVDPLDRQLPPSHVLGFGDIFTNTNLCIINVDGVEQLQGTSKSNAQEASCVSALCQQLHGVEAFNGIGVITPYAAHVGNIQKELVQAFGPTMNDIEVSSVDGFQGQEKDVIILSTCRVNPQKEIGFVADWRRMNVSLTRARYCLFVVCNVETLAGDHLWQDFLRFYKQNIKQWDPMSRKPVAPGSALSRQIASFQTLDALMTTNPGVRGVPNHAQYTPGFDPAFRNMTGPMHGMPSPQCRMQTQRQPYQYSANPKVHSPRNMSPNVSPELHPVQVPQVKPPGINGFAHLSSGISVQPPQVHVSAEQPSPVRGMQPNIGGMHPNIGGTGQNDTSGNSIPLRMNGLTSEQQSPVHELKPYSGTDEFSSMSADGYQNQHPHQHQPPYPPQSPPSAQYQAHATPQSHQSSNSYQNNVQQHTPPKQKKGKQQRQQQYQQQQQQLFQQQQQQQYEQLQYSTWQHQQLLHQQRQQPQKQPQQGQHQQSSPLHSQQPQLQIQQRHPQSSPPHSQQPQFQIQQRHPQSSPPHSQQPQLQIQQWHPQSSPPHSQQPQLQLQQQLQQLQFNQQQQHEATLQHQACMQYVPTTTQAMHNGYHRDANTQQTWNVLAQSTDNVQSKAAPFQKPWKNSYGVQPLLNNNQNTQQRQDLLSTQLPTSYGPVSQYCDTNRIHQPSSMTSLLALQSQGGHSALGSAAPSSAQNETVRHCPGGAHDVQAEGWVPGQMPNLSSIQQVCTSLKYKIPRAY